MRNIKRLVILAILLFSSVCIYSEKNTGTYHIRCERCRELTHQHKTDCNGCNMWRMTSLEIRHMVYEYDKDKRDYILVEKEGLGKLVYQCKHGHRLVIK